MKGIHGFPDGMAIDDEGGLWIAIWGGGKVNHYDRSGQFVDSIVVPGVTQVSSCAFGGDALDVLFITSSRKDIRRGDEPDAGAIFAIQTAVRGQPLAEFKG